MPSFFITNFFQPPIIKNRRKNKKRKKNEGNNYINKRKGKRKERKKERKERKEQRNKEIKKRKRTKRREKHCNLKNCEMTSNNVIWTKISYEVFNCLSYKRSPVQVISCVKNSHQVRKLILSQFFKILSGWYWDIHSYLFQARAIHLEWSWCGFV